MDKKLLKEINKLKYLNKYDRGKTLTENRVLITKQPLPLAYSILKQEFRNLVVGTLEAAMKLNVTNVAEYFGKEVVAEVDALIAKSISKGRLLSQRGMFNGNSIDLALSMFRKWVQKGSTELMSPLERNIFYEAIAKAGKDGEFNISLLKAIGETTDGIALKSGTMSDEALQVLIKNADSPLHGFSENFLRQIAKSEGNTIKIVNKVTAAAEESLRLLGIGADRMIKLMQKGWTWIGGTGLFKAGVTASSKVKTAIVEKQLVKMAKSDVRNIPGVLEKLGLKKEYVDKVILAIEKGTSVSSDVIDEIFIILISKSTRELEMVFDAVFKDLTRNKFFRKNMLEYLSHVVVKGEGKTEAAIVKEEIQAIKELLGLADERVAKESVELASMILKSIKAGGLGKRIWTKIWRRNGSDTSRFIHFITCGKIKGWRGFACGLLKVHLITSLMPWESFPNLKNAYNALVGAGSADEEDELKTLKDILDPPSGVVTLLNDPTHFQFLASNPASKNPTAGDINKYYDNIAEQIGTVLLTFVPTDGGKDIGILPPEFQVDPDSPPKHIDITDLYKSSEYGTGNWYVGPSLADLNQITDNDVLRSVMHLFSADWNNIDESEITNIMSSRPSRFGIAKTAERYKILTGGKRSLWDDLDQLQMGHGILQKFITNLFLITDDTTKHDISLEAILKKPEYQKNDLSGADYIVRDPRAEIWKSWWDFPDELTDLIETDGQVEEVVFKSAISGPMPVDLMAAFMRGETFIMEDAEGNTAEVVVTTEEDLYNVPAKQFNAFLREEALPPFNKDIYHHPYIYKLEVVGVDGDGLEIKQWNRKANPAYISSPKSSGIREAYDKKMDELQNPTEESTEIETEDGNN